MATVERYTRRRAAPEALPGARLTAAETPTSQGAGLAVARGEAGAAVGQAIEGAGAPIARIGLRQFAEIQQTERENADRTALLAASNKLAAWKSVALYDPTSGALAQRGENSFGLPETVRGDFDRVAGDIEKSFTTDRQKAAWAQVRSQEWQNVDLTVRRHVYGEMQTYRASELEKAVANGSDEAIRNYQDPRLVGASLQKVIDQIQANAPTLGLGKEAIEAQVRAVSTGVHTGVIAQLLADEKPTQARDYFNATKDQIAASQHDGITKALEEGSVRKQGQQISDKIIAEGGTLTQQREKARAIDDAKVRDEVMSRIEHESAVQEHAQREQERTTLRGVYDILDRGKGVGAIPPAVWAGLDAGDRSSARSYARELAQGIPTKTDDAVFYGLMRTAIDDPEKFTTANLWKYRSSLSSGDFQQLAGIQLSFSNAARSKEATAEGKKVDEFRTRSEIMNNSLAAYGIPTEPSKQTTDQKRAIGSLSRMLDRRLEALGPGARVTNTEIQTAIDGILSTSVNVPGSWWNIFPGGKPFFDSTKKFTEITIDDVPTSTRTDIEQRLRRQGMPVTDDTVLTVFLESQVK